MSDHKFLTEILLACSRGSVRLFRNNVAQGWAGKSTMLPNGNVIVEHPHRLHAGLHVGSGDLIGWKSITVTPEMVGHKLAVFVSLEGKQGRDRMSTEQKQWRDQVLLAGGIAVEIRSVDDAVEAVK